MNKHIKKFINNLNDPIFDNNVLNKIIIFLKNNNVYDDEIEYLNQERGRILYHLLKQKIMNNTLNKNNKWKTKDYIKYILDENSNDKLMVKCVKSVIFYTTIKILEDVILNELINTVDL